MMTLSRDNTDMQPIAYDELAARCMEKIDFIERVLNSFSSRFAEDLHHLEQEIESRDNQAVARLAHRMKGACSNTAAHELHSYVSRIERLARDDRLTEVPSCLDGIHRAWNDFQHAVAALPAKSLTVSAKV